MDRPATRGRVDRYVSMAVGYVFEWLTILVKAVLWIFLGGYILRAVLARLGYVTAAEWIFKGQAWVLRHIYEIVPPG